MVTRAELLARASALVPVLKERAAQTEELRQLPDETVRGLLASGLIRIGTPERYGGLGIEYDAAFEVSWELGRGCGSSAWCYSLWTVHNWWVGHFPVQAQDEFFANGPDALASTSLSPAGARAEAVDDGFRLSGQWSFSSGCDASSWAMLGFPGPEGVLWAMLPRADYEILDTWFTSGMRGTGSKDILVTDAFVPSYRTLDPSCAGERDLTGWEAHKRLSYRVPMRCLTGWDLVAPLIGIAQGTIDEFAGRLRGTSGAGRTADSVPLQMRLAEASAEVDASRSLLQQDIVEMLDKAAGGEAFTDLDKARYRRDKAFISRLCVNAVNRLFEASGGHAIYDANVLQRLHRDAHSASHHAGLNWDMSAEDFGRQSLGLKPLPPRTG